jgi:hypothetical protein
MMKPLLGLIVLLVMAQAQSITPYYILPVQTTQGSLTSYSFLLGTDTNIATNAQVALTFPFEFSPNVLTQVTRVRYAMGSGALQVAKWSIYLYTFTIEVGTISIGNITIVIDNVRNPSEYTASSYFVARTLFKNVEVTSNS